MLQNEKLLRLYKWFNDKKAPPLKAVTIPTNRCNLMCSFCPNALPRSKGKFKREDELEDEEWLKVIEEGLEFGIREWSIIGGGEPMLRRNAVISMVKAIKSYEELTDCEIITNGTLFREEDIRKLVSFKLDRILISIDAPDAETHDFLRGVRGTFKKASRSLKMFAEWKKKFETDKPYLKVNMVLNSRNITKITTMVKFLKKIGAQELALHPMREYWKLKSQIGNLKLNEREENLLSKSVRQAQRISKKLGIFLNTDMLTIEQTSTKEKNEAKPLSVLTEKIIRSRCFEPFYSILIDPEGCAAPCSPAGQGIPTLNVLTYSLPEIWASKEFDEVRKKISKGMPLNNCHNCGLLDMHERLRRELIEFVYRGNL